MQCFNNDVNSRYEPAISRASSSSMDCENCEASAEGPGLWGDMPLRSDAPPVGDRPRLRTTRDPALERFPRALIGCEECDAKISPS